MHKTRLYYAHVNALVKLGVVLVVHLVQFFFFVGGEFFLVLGTKVMPFFSAPSRTSKSGFFLSIFPSASAFFE